MLLTFGRVCAKMGRQRRLSPHGRARGGLAARWPKKPMSWGGGAKISEIMGSVHD